MSNMPIPYVLQVKDSHPKSNVDGELKLLETHCKTSDVKVTTFMFCPTKCPEVNSLGLQNLTQPSKV